MIPASGSSVQEASSSDSIFYSCHLSIHVWRLLLATLGLLFSPELGGAFQEVRSKVRQIHIQQTLLFGRCGSLIDKS